MEAEVRERLDIYLRGDGTLDDLRRWLVERTWGNPDAPELAHAVEYLLDEAASGTFSRKQLDRELRVLLAAARVSDAPARTPVVS